MTSIQAPKPYADTVVLDSLKSNQASRGEGTPAWVDPGSGTDTVDVGMREVYKSLTVLSDKIIKKLDEVLGAAVPGGVRSLNPEDHTPEKTAQRIVDGVTGLMSIYAKQNPNMQGEKLISSFMDLVRGGVEQGYNDAMDVLKAIDALSVDGVQSGIEETMTLVDRKLTAWETAWRKDQGLIVEEETAEANDGEGDGEPAPVGEN